MLPLTVFFVRAFLAWTALYPHFNPYSYSYVAVTLVVVVALRDTFRLEMHLGWALAWAQFFLGMHFVLVPGVGFVWNATWLALLAGLWFLLQPPRGWVSLLLFGTIPGSLRFVVYTVYLFYWLHPDKSSLPLFSLCAHLVRRPKRPVKRLEKPIDSNGQTVHMCEKCRSFVYSSRLIMGSSLPLVWLTEEHKHYDMMEDLRVSAKGRDRDPDFGFPSCFVCNLLWRSVSKKGRKAAELAANRGGKDPRPLCVKVWDERPLSLYTYAQLHVGKKAVGARLLLQRGTGFPFQAASSAASVPTTDSYDHCQLAGRWINQCKTHHSLCGTALGTSFPLPTRLLHVRWKFDHPTAPGRPRVQLRLVITAEEMADTETPPPYVALSHRWESHVPLVLEKHTLADFCKADGIPVERLGRSLRDAMRVVLGMRYAYMWIDSLCIIQGDDEDWAREAPRMADVYAGAVCTIAATAATEDKGGFFRTRNTHALRIYQIGGERAEMDTRRLMSRACKDEEEEEEERYEVDAAVASVSDASGSAIYMRFDDGFDFERHVDHAPINSRGWVFQERLLSSRILHFGPRMLYWECWQRSASEAFPRGYVYKRYPDGFTDDYVPRITNISTPEQLKKAEEEARGAYWAYQRGIRDRPPAPAKSPDDSDDPDAPTGTDDPDHVDNDLFQDDDKKNRETIWGGQTFQRWHDIHKPSRAHWRYDSTETSGFRDAYFRLLRRGYDLDGVAPDSFTHTWYQLVRPYSHGRLTCNKDKLGAIAAIVKSLQKEHGYTYLAGLWREFLLTGLVWFVEDGSIGCRLTMESPEKKTDVVPVCPTWSWASVEGTVDVHLVPDNALCRTRVSREMATVEDVSVTAVYGGDTSIAAPLEGKLIMKGLLVPISKMEPAAPRHRQKIWLDIPTRRPVWAWFKRDTDEQDDGCDLFSLPLLELETAMNFERGPSWEVQGIVLSRKRGAEVFQRRGHFVVDGKHFNEEARVVLCAGDRVTIEIV